MFYFMSCIKVTTLWVFMFFISTVRNRANFVYGFLSQPFVKRKTPSQIDRHNCISSDLSPTVNPYSLDCCNSISGTITMPRGVKKEHLPTKICLICNRPFTWRKKWEKCWDEVTTCSKSCNRKRKQAKQVDINELTLEKMEINLNDEKKSEEQEDLLECRNARCTTNSEEYSISDKSPNSSNELLLELSKSNVIFDEAESKLEGIEQDSLLNQHSGENVEFALSDREEDFEEDPVARRKAERKALKKKKKAERRAQREGRGDTSAGQKLCDMCGKSVDLLIRCTYDETQQWKMVCGSCWKKASGGIVDGDSSHPYYRYGGLWKNRRKK